MSMFCSILFVFGFYTKLSENVEEKISHVRLVGFKMPPMVTVEKNGPNIDFGGPFVALLKHALRNMNVSFTCIESPDPSHGNELSPGNTTGLLSVLHKKNADVIVQPFAITYMRMKYVDYTNVFYYSTLTCMSGSPKNYFEDNVSLIDVFDIQVWSLTILTLILLPLAFYILLKVDKDKEENLLDCFFYFFASFTWKEFPEKLYMNKKHRKIVVLFWFIGTFCLTSAYLGTLLSFLTIPETPERIDSIEDIVKYPNMDPLIMRGSVMFQAVKRSVKPKLKQLYKQIVERKSEVLYTEMLKPENLGRTSDGLSVIMADKLLITLSLRYGCVPGAEFYFAKHPFFYSGTAFAMRKGMPYSFQKGLRKAMSMFATTHQTEHWVSHYALGAAKCLVAGENQQQNENDETPLSLKNLKHAFWCLAVGLLLSCVAFLAELITFRFRNKVQDEINTRIKTSEIKTLV